MTLAALAIVAGIVLLYAGIRGYKITDLLHGKLTSSGGGSLLS